MGTQPSSVGRNRRKQFGVRADWDSVVISFKISFAWRPHLLPFTKSIPFLSFVPKIGTAVHSNPPAHVIRNQSFSMATTTTRPPSKLYDLDITIVSAKHIKNVNWRQGDLKPYCIFWIDPDRRLATKSDDSGSTRPDSLLTLEIFHSKPSETPKPLVGTLRLQIKELLDSDDSGKLKAFELRRPSGRPQDYQVTPPSSYYYSTAPPTSLPATRDFRGYSSPYVSHTPAPPPPPAAPSPPLPPPPHAYPYSGYSDPYSSYYPGYYPQQPPPPPPRPFFERQSSYGAPGPSAPVDYASYEQKRGGKMGMGAGLAVGAVAGALGGLALEEGLKYEEEKIAERVENDLATRDDYSDYRDY
ncbi:hypothetical protein M9H77_10894 [Catharanthus roseus]|uniref:Uncharacterized protein n=1 Tax=Catharanthus roseus TaxID=4058 RepID=A0ACC0BD23_CATRO|nr:hypothetical protein M9H77_10894 [Catharanthus roseus]